MSSDLDAYRRHRGAEPQQRLSALISAISRIKPSADPHVVFSRLAEICVSNFADGCQIELSDGTEQPLRVHLDRTDGDATVQQPRDQGVVEVPFQSTERGGQPSYAGIFTVWWRSRRATESDWTIAALLVKYVGSVVDFQRLTQRAGESDTRAATAVMDAIASRQVNLAIGLLMGRSGCSAAEAESHLVDLADERDAQLYTVAADVVRKNHLTTLTNVASEQSFATQIPDSGPLPK